LVLLLTGLDEKRPAKKTTNGDSKNEFKENYSDV